MAGWPARAGRLRRRASVVVVAAAATAALATATATPASAQPIYGVVPQDGAIPDAADLDLMPSGGVQSIRLMAHWPTLEPIDDVYDWSSLDGMVREATNHGVQPFLFLYGSPPWVSEADHRNCETVECSVFPPASPGTRKAFADFATAAVQRYGPDGDFWKAPVQPISSQAPRAAPRRAPAAASLALDPDPCQLIPCPQPPPPVPPSPVPGPNEPPCGCTEAHPIRQWQLWNEQNSPKYFAPRPDVGAYAGMVKVAGDAIHAVDPGADVVLGGMWGPGNASDVVVPVRQYLRDFYGVDGIEKSFDSIAIHPYSENVSGAVAQLRAAHAASRRAGDGKAGLWVTELGWAASGPKNEPYVKGLQGQARMLTRALTAFERNQRAFRLRGVFWYSWRDRPGGGSICTWCGHAGLRAKDGSAKPAWRAFSRVATR